jgi:hypothetical protein
MKIILYNFKNNYQINFIFFRINYLIIIIFFIYTIYYVFIFSRKYDIYYVFIILIIIKKCIIDIY